MFVCLFVIVVLINIKKIYSIIKTDFYGVASRPSRCGLLLLLLLIVFVVLFGMGGNEKKTPVWFSYLHGIWSAFGVFCS